MGYETLRGFFRGKRGNDNSRDKHHACHRWKILFHSYVCKQKKKSVHVFEMQFNGNERGKKGDVLRESEKEKSDIETTIIIRFGHLSTVQDFSSTLGEGGNPRSKSFSNRYVFSHPPWKDIMRFHEEYKSYEIYCRTLLCLFISVSTFWRLGMKKKSYDWLYFLEDSRWT